LIKAIIAFVVVASIPSAITSFYFWKIQRELDKRKREQNKHKSSKNDSADGSYNVTCGRIARNGIGCVPDNNVGNSRKKWIKL